MVCELCLNKAVTIKDQSNIYDSNWGKKVADVGASSW